MRFVLLQNELNGAFSLTWPTSMQMYWNKRKRLHKKKEFNVHRIGLEHQYGRRDVMWKHSIAMLVARFSYHPRIKSVLQQISLLQVAESCCRSRKLFYFLQENLYNLRAFYLPKANLFCSKSHNSHVQRDSRVIFSNQNPIWMQIPTTWFVGRQV